MILARTGSLSAVADRLAAVLGQPFHPVRERLRDRYREADAKAGTHRAQREVSAWWAPWLAWVLEGWSEPRLAVALDATSWGQRLVVLPLSVLYRGGAVPVAWKGLKAAQKQPWKPQWLALLRHFKGLVPPAGTVIVLADRGLYAQGRFEGIAALGWHPVLRLNGGGSFRPRGWYHWVPLPRRVAAVGCRWQGQGTAFVSKPARLNCTLLGCWEAGHQDRWLLLTAPPPHAADACWYGLRAGIEQGFKRFKRGGWQWQYPRRDAPARAERLWLALALATGWLLAVGGEAEAKVPLTTLPPVPGAAREPRRRWRLVGSFRHGWALISAALVNHQPLPFGQGQPEPWPTVPIPQNSAPLAVPAGGI